MAQEDIKKAITKEYIRCKTDPIYFMRKYCYIQHPQKGRILFNLYPFQEGTLKLLQDNQYAIILKSRQLGISTISAAYSLWLMLFHKDKNILALATTQATARNLVTKTIFMYEELPKWMKLPHVEKNKLSLRLKNGSKIHAKSSNADAARSEAVSLLIIDEAAFIDNIDETFASAQQTLATGGQCIALSTPNGVGNWFHKTWENAKENENSFVPIKLPWTVHPERDQEWRDKQDKDLGKRMAAQECDCSFITSGGSVIDPLLLEKYKEEHIKDPIEKRGADSNLWIWEYPNYTKEYIVSVDVARGDGNDNSTFHVIDVESCTQVAEYRGKVSPKDLGNIVVGIGTEYNNALLAVENASIGWATIEQILTREYPNLHYSSKGSNDTVESYMQKYDKSQLTPGFNMTLRTRPLVIAKFIEFVMEESVIIRSIRTMGEIRVFEWKNGKAQAQNGYNDDLVIALAIGLYVREHALKLFHQGIDRTNAQLSALTNVNRRNKNIQSTYPPETREITNKTVKVEGQKRTGVVVGNKSKNPYTMRTRYGTHDFSWLI